MRHLRITIGIPTLNGPDLLARCLESVGACTRWAQWDNIKVLAVDDGSEEEQLKLTKDAIHRASTAYPAMGLELLVHGQRRGIAAGWNSLTRHRECDVVALLNNDIEAVDDWLEALVFSLDANPLLGMVGLNSYVGVTKAQVADAVVGVPTHSWRPDVDFSEARLMDGDGSLLTSCGYAFAFRRQDYEDVGGFDERYFCFYEEVDFGVALRQRGFRCAMTSHPLVYHMGGATNSEPRNLVAADRMAESRAKFVEKWGCSPEELRQRMSYGKPMPMRCWNSQMRNLV